MRERDAMEIERRGDAIARCFVLEAELFGGAHGGELREHKGKGRIHGGRVSSITGGEGWETRRRAAR